MLYGATLVAWLQQDFDLVGGTSRSVGRSVGLRRDSAPGDVYY